MIPRPPCTPLFPYTTLFRSEKMAGSRGRAADRGAAGIRADAQPADRRIAAREGHGAFVRAPDTGWRYASTGGSARATRGAEDRKSTRLNSSHLVISYAVFCL